jgi:hypothetical protein
MKKWSILKVSSRSHTERLRRTTMESYIHQTFIADCIALFRTYGCEISQGEAPSLPPKDRVAGAIRAGSDQIELSLTLCMPSSVLGLSYPCQEQIMEIPEEDLEDWLLELTNQLMGRIKHRLMHQQVTVNLGLPETFFDTGWQAALSGVQKHTRLSFNVDNHWIDCWLRIEIKQPSAQCASAEASQAAPEYGEVELF